MTAIPHVRPGVLAGRCALVLALICLGTAPAKTASRKQSSTSRPQNLKDSIDRLLARPELEGAKVGVHVVQLPAGKILYAREADRQLLPASNIKLLTTAAALQGLGPGHEFRTRVGLAGRDLVVVGGGDPAIGGRFSEGDPTAYFRRWAKLLKAGGVDRVAGDLVVDDSYFDRQFVHPDWPKNDLGHWYAAPVAALALNESCVRVQIAPGAAADAPGRVTITPATRYFQITNHTRTVKGAKQHAPRVSRRPGSLLLECDGPVYARAEPLTTSVAVDDPVMYFGHVLRDVLAQEGIQLAGGVRREAGIGSSAEFRPIVVHRFPLLPVLQVTNKESQNFYAEQLLKTLGAEHGDGSWTGGRQAAARALTALGIESDSYVLDDGCGLARADRASARTFTRLLAAVQQRPYAQPFRQTLAVSGTDGTLRKRLTEEPYRGRVLGKTGSIQGVRAISGYVHTRSGEWLAFSFLVNNPKRSVRAIQDDFCKLLVDWQG